MQPIIPVVYLGTTPFVVRYEPSLADEGILGRIALLQGVIELRPNMAAYMELQTLWHEALHAILFLGGIKQHDDQMLDVLARGIIQLMSQNPEMVKQE